MTFYSDNGWPGITDVNDTVSTKIPGLDESLRTAPGDVAWILTNFASRFNTEVEPIVGPVFDDWGWNYRLVRGSSINLSCHASGTAIDLNATQHPRGKTGTFTKNKEAAIRSLLTDFEIPDSGLSVIKWGKDFVWPSEPDEMHFQIRGNASDVHSTRLAMEENMPLSKDDIAAIWEWDGIPNQNGPKDNPNWTPKSMLSDIENTQDTHTVKIDAIEADVAAILKLLQAKA